MSQETKEGFCTTCATGLMAITGMGISGSSKLGDPEKDKERKKTPLSAWYLNKFNFPCLSYLSILFFGL